MNINKTSSHLTEEEIKKLKFHMELRDKAYEFLKDIFVDPTQRDNCAHCVANAIEEYVGIS